MLRTSTETGLERYLSAIELQRVMRASDPSEALDLAPIWDHVEGQHRRKSCLSELRHAEVRGGEPVAQRIRATLLTRSLSLVAVSGRACPEVRPATMNIFPVLTFCSTAGLRAGLILCALFMHVWILRGTFRSCTHRHAPRRLAAVDQPVSSGSLGDGREHPNPWRTMGAEFLYESSTIRG